jgi:hypothetical protein
MEQGIAAGEEKKDTFCTNSTCGKVTRIRPINA